MKFSTLSEKDRRTVRMAAIGLGVYLALFFGWRALGFLSRRHAEYQQLQTEARALRSRLDLYSARAARVERLMETFQMDPAHLNQTTLVARAGEAIQQTAAQGGLQLGPIRETGQQPTVQLGAGCRQQGEKPTLVAS